MGRKVASNRLHNCVNAPYSHPLSYHHGKRHTQRSEVSPSDITPAENTSANVPQKSVAGSFTVIPPR